MSQKKEEKKQSKRRYIDTYVVKLKPPPEHTRPKIVIKKKTKNGEGSS